jgi:hypothetical protein
MARRQGAARDRRPPPPLSGSRREPDRSGAPAGASADGEPAPAPTVAVHDLAQARAALEAAGELGLSITLVTAPGLVAMAGVGFCVALEEALGRPLLIDCGSEPGTALAALRAGARRLVLAGAPAARGKLEDIARQLGACLLAAPPAPLLTLAPGEDPRAALRRLLAGPAGCDPSSAASEGL